MQIQVLCPQCNAPCANDVDVQENPGNAPLPSFKVNLKCDQCGVLHPFRLQQMGTMIFAVYDRPKGPAGC